MQPNQLMTVSARCASVAVSDSSGWPRNEKRHTMPTFINRAFITSKRPRCDGLVNLRPVVAGKDDERRLNQFLFCVPRIVRPLQPVEHSSQSDIILVNITATSVQRMPCNVPAGSDNGLISHMRIWSVGAVVRIAWVVKKERPAPRRFVRDVALQKLHGII